jgi:Cu/Ag efflux protein CusF
VTHPKNPKFMPANRDFVFLLNAYDVEPGSATPKVSTMLDFNLFNFNSRVFPGIDTMVVRHNDRVRIRIGNLTMTNHPIHLHGHEFEVTGTDGGWTPRGSRWPEVTVDIGVGQMRAIEFDATEEGDWAFLCHKSHHTMNAMGHDVPTMIGVDQRAAAAKIAKLVPDYMVMGERGMADMGEMEMLLPDNTLPMMTGQGPFGSIEMGGMFTTVKVRRSVAHDRHGRARHVAVHAGQAHREARRDDPLRHAQQGEDPARDRHRHDGRAQGACRADAEVPRNGARRRQHGARGARSIGRDRMDVQSIGHVQLRLPDRRPLRRRDGRHDYRDVIGALTPNTIQIRDLIKESFMYPTRYLSAAIALAASQLVSAQPTVDGPLVVAQSVQAPATVDGEVRKIDKDASKITLKHGPIPNLDMPGMTMVFRVQDPAMLDAVKTGDKVRFSADKVGGALTITQMTPVK